MKKIKIISKSLEDTAKVAKLFLSDLKFTRPIGGAKSSKLKSTLLLLEGDLGSGKTTFTQVLARELGIKNYLTSPTFVLMKSYKISKEATERLCLSVKRLIHIDAYRLNSGADLLNLGWAEFISNPDNLIVLEWPEKVADLFNGSEYKINFKFIGEETREIQWLEKTIKQK